MNCAYHVHNAAVVSCNGCGKPLCPTCDHRIKGFPFCQDCIVSGVELLRNRGNFSAAAFVKKRTSPLIATVLSFICPGLGAAYNGQMTKALIYFAVFVGLFQMATLTGGMPLFVLGFLGMWLFAALDSWRTAQIIKTGITPDGAEDLIAKRISGNPKVWGIVLAVLGLMFFFQSFLNMRQLLKAVLPVLLLGLGAYLLREHFFKANPGETLAGGGTGGAAEGTWMDFANRTDTPRFGGKRGETSFRTGEYEASYRTDDQAAGSAATRNRHNG